VLVCAKEFDDEDVVELLLVDGTGSGAGVLANYRRFRAEAADPNVRFCPYCGDRSSGGSAESPAIVCANEACGRGFCFLHANAHAAGAGDCAEYERAHRAENDANLAAIRIDSKLCPHCGTFVSKAAGCNHVKCTFCQKSFCWLCGNKVSDSTMPLHYQWFNLGGCANRQFGSDVRITMAERFVNVLYAIVVGVPSTIVTAAVFVGCACVCIPAGLSFDGGIVEFFLTMTSFVCYAITVTTLVVVCAPFVVAAFVVALIAKAVVLPPVMLLRWLGVLPPRREDEAQAHAEVASGSGGVLASGSSSTPSPSSS